MRPLRQISLLHACSGTSRAWDDDATPLNFVHGSKFTQIAFEGHRLGDWLAQWQLGC
jgi:hypothetical protein